MICHEVKGNWVCEFKNEIQEEPQEISYTIDNFQSIEVYEEHMSECMITFLDGQVVDVCQTSLENALEKYDKFIYCMSVLDKGLFEE